jgi:hypothetical protein
MVHFGKKPSSGKLKLKRHINLVYMVSMFKLFTNKNHSYKHNEQINNQDIDNSECFGVQFVKIYPEMTSK